MDLFDEAGRNSSEKVAGSVRNLGGDLFDEVAVKSNKPELLSTRVNNTSVTPDIEAALDEMNANLSTMERFLIGAGRGLTSVARGLGLAEPEDPITKKAFSRLADDSISAQAGEVIGEAAPFLLAAPLAGAGLATSTGGRAIIPAAKSLGARVAGTGALGTAEGVTLSKGKGGDESDQVAAGVIGGTLAGAIEAISPFIVRMGGALFRRLGRKPKGNLLTPDGRPTPEFQQVLDETGTSFKDLTDDAFAKVNQANVNPQQAARAARFESLGIPATQGDITQDFAQQSLENRLLSQAGAEAGEPLRQLKLNQSQAFIGKVNDLVDGLGAPDELGDAVKDALLSRKSLLRSEKNALYKQVAELSPQAANVPLMTQTIVEALPDSGTLRRLKRLSGNQVQAVESLLVEFGVNRNPDDVAKFLASGDEITPLNLSNFEDFRQAINQIERADTTGATKVVTGPIKTALDAEAEIVDNAFKGVNVDDSVLDLLKQARQRVRTLKTEFSPQSITGRLIDVKRDGVTPVIESSKVVSTLLRDNVPVEHLQRTITALRASGDKGRKAIKDMQAAVVLNALEAGLKAPSVKTSGVQTIGGNNFAKQLSKFGDDKLNVLFQNNEKALQRLRNLKQTALDITPAAAATPKGSAPVILDILNRTGQLPGLAALRDMVSLIAKAGSDERAVRKAMNAKPAFLKMSEAMGRDFPALASVLGVAAVTPEQDTGE